MHNLDNSIAEAYFKGYIDREEAVTRSNNPGKMEKMLAPMTNAHLGRSRKQKKPVGVSPGGHEMAAEQFEMVE